METLGERERETKIWKSVVAWRCDFLCSALGSRYMCAKAKPKIYENNKHKFHGCEPTTRRRRWEKQHNSCLSLLRLLRWSVLGLIKFTWFFFRSPWEHNFKFRPHTFHPLQSNVIFLTFALYAINEQTWTYIQWRGGSNKAGKKKNCNIENNLLAPARRKKMCTVDVDLMVKPQRRWIAT